MLLLEVTTGYLYQFTEFITPNVTSSQGGDVSLLKAITTPLTSRIVKVRSAVHPVMGNILRSFQN